MIGVTADSNIYILAFHFGRQPRLFVNAAVSARFRLDISPPLLAETSRILRDKFKWSDAMLHEQVVRLNRLTHLVHPQQVIDAVPDDPDDNRVLECAVAAGSRHIMTGDSDLLRLGRYESIDIISVGDFMNLLPT